MTQIKKKDQSRPVSRLRDSMARAVKWWAEHQAWPATDEIRISHRHPNCG